MTIPLAVLAVFAILLGFLGTPAWPWFEAYLNGHHATFEFGKLFESGTLGLMLVSTVVVGVGVGLGWKVYAKATDELDPIEKAQPVFFNLLRNKFLIDELYGATVIRLNATLSNFSDWLDRAIWGGIVKAISSMTIGLSRLNRTIDEDLVNLGFDHGCEGLRDSSHFLSKLQDGRVQDYLRAIGVALVALLLMLLWGWGQ